MSAKRKATSTASRESQRVLLELAWPGAQAVFIAGSFNDWHPGVSPMLRLTDGTWFKELVLAPGRYEYRFVVDGVWVDDPAAPDYIPNPFGGMNSVLTVAASAPPSPSPRRISSRGRTTPSRLPNPA